MGAAQSQAADRLVPLLRERWDRETSPVISASVLRGLSFLNPAGTMRLAAVALDSQDSTIRLVAAQVYVNGGISWSAGLAEAALAWTADGALMKGFPWSFFSGHPFSDLLVTLAARGNPAAAADLASAALIAPLTSVAACEDPEASLSAIHQLRELGALAQAADQLAAIADWALTCLAEIGDPRCVRLLVRSRRHRPFALGALLRTGQVAARPPFTPELLEEVRARLRGQLLGEQSTPHLAALIGSWGRAAAAAVPDLLAILPRHGYRVGCALADIAGATPDAVRLLRQEASSGTSLDAAVRLHALTGDEQALLAAVESGLAQTGAALSRAAEAARSFTPDRQLIPALNAALDATADHARRDNGIRSKLALALWHYSGDPGAALGVIAGILDAETARGRPGRGTAGAVDAAAAIGPEARPLIPAILPLLDSPATCTAAVRALMRIDPDTHGNIPAEEPADRLLLPLGRAWRHTQMTAIQTLGEIGLPRLPHRVTTSLRQLADQDRRIDGGGVVQHRIRDDDQLRAAIRDLLDGTAQATPH